MPVYWEIRADFDRETIVVYQAYNDAIADAALRAGRFAPPFSLNRMTWIKPSFLWMMARSGWATKANQTRVLAVRLRREAWDSLLARATLTSFTPRVHDSPDAWREEFERAEVHVQWDPERSLREGKLPHRAIQVGIGRTLISDYASDWITNITDATPVARRIADDRRRGDERLARRLLPVERVYPVEPETARRLAMTLE